MQLLELGKDMSQGQIFQKINEEFWIIILIRSSYVTASWGGDEDRAGKGAKGKGVVYWLASLRWSHSCDMLLEGLCCPCPSPRKMARKLVMEPVIHKTSDIPSHSGTLFTKADTYANPRHTVHTIYTHRHTLIRADTRVVREITVE